MANTAAHMACHAPACTCGAGNCNHHRCRHWTNMPVACPSARAAACATGHQQKAWSRQISGVNGPSAGGAQPHGHACVPTMS
eukprot:274476-Chlamydomonas_euryale.AAC.1